MANKVSCASRISTGLSVRNMSQADLCRKTGIPKSAMSQYVNGGLVPRQDRTFLIAAALDVNEAWLMGFDVPMERSEAKQALLKYIDSLSDDQAAFCLRVLKAALEKDQKED